MLALLRVYTIHCNEKHIYSRPAVVRKRNTKKVLPSNKTSGKTSSRPDMLTPIESPVLIRASSEPIMLHRMQSSLRSILNINFGENMCDMRFHCLLRNQ